MNLLASDNLYVQFLPFIDYPNKENLILFSNWLISREIIIHWFSNSPESILLSEMYLTSDVASDDLCDISKVISPWKLTFYAKLH